MSEAKVAPEGAPRSMATAAIVPPKGSVLHSAAMAVLYIFAGLPGTGKTALSRALAGELNAAYIRIDTIEQTLRDLDRFYNGAAGYDIAYRIAADDLALDVDVVADSVNPLDATRRAWREAANSAGAVYVDIEIICSDETEHRERVESRKSDIPGLILPTWKQVLEREYEPWTAPHLTIDTAGKTIEQSFQELRRSLEELRAE